MRVKHKVVLSLFRLSWARVLRTLPTSSEFLANSCRRTRPELVIEVVWILPRRLAWELFTYPRSL